MSTDDDDDNDDADNNDNDNDKSTKSTTIINMAVVGVRSTVSIYSTMYLTIRHTFQIVVIPPELPALIGFPDKLAGFIWLWLMFLTACSKHRAEHMPVQATSFSPSLNVKSCSDPTFLHHEQGPTGFDSGTFAVSLYVTTIPVVEGSSQRQCRTRTSLEEVGQDTKVIVNKLIWLLCGQHCIWSVKAVSMWSVCGQYVVGMWFICSWYVVGKAGWYVVGKGGRYLVGMWSVCGGHVVGKSGWYVVGKSGW